MRRIDLATLLLAAFALIASGCQQTAGTTGAGASVGTLSPVGQGQTPTLGPFGGQTRVTPPETGSYVVPGSYIGGAPVSQTNPGYNSVGGIASQNTPTAIGSGVQAAGWTETNSVVSQAGATPIGPSNFGPSPSAAGNPRSGGMQVIDLTGSPPPPGYRPPARSNYQPQAPAVAPVNQYPQQGWQSGQQQPAPQQSSQTPSGLQPINTPVQGQLAHSPAPVSQGFPPASNYQSNQSSAIQSSMQSVPRTASAPTQVPSTEPIANGSGSQNLSWRQPGTQY